MFCPKCGSEIAEDIKFCPKCGEQIAKKAAAGKVQEKKVPWKGGLGKIILLAVIFIVILAAYKIISHNGENADGVETNGGDYSKTDKSKKKKRGFSSYEDAIDALFTAAYDKDVEGVINCFPEEMESHVKEIYNLYRASRAQPGFWSGDNLNNRNISACGFFAFENLNMDYEYWYVIKEAKELEQCDEINWFHKFTIDELQTEFGITVDEAYMVEVESRSKHPIEIFGSPGTTGTIDEGTSAYFEVGKIGKKWYILRFDHVWLDWYE